MDRERLQRLASELAEAQAARQQGKHVRLPVIQPADAAALVNDMHAELDRAIARRDAAVGARYACKKGCNSCCVSPVLITEGEAVAIATWLREPAQAGVRARFAAGYPAWRDKLGELVETNVARTEDEARAWGARVIARQAMCPFNIDGACAIYPVRPGMCRKAHALDTHEHCVNNSAKVQYYQHPETEGVYQGHLDRKLSIHLSLRPNARLELIPAAVHRVLASSGGAPGRNDPCSCGSGKKYKKCCGA